MKMNKPFPILFSFLIIFILILLTACLGGGKTPEAYEDQVEAGVAATLTKEAFVQSVDIARQTESANEGSSDGQETDATPTVTATPDSTPTPEPDHLISPDSPPQSIMFISDIVTVDLAKDKNALGDNYAWGRLERPYTSVRMEYRDYLDIYQVAMGVADPWVYITIILIGNLPGEGDIRYAVEIDTDHDGRGDFLVMASLPPDSAWTTDGVVVMADDDEDVGGLFPLYMDESSAGLTGYERELFSNGQGQDRDLAWVRRDPKYRNQIQFAFKDSLGGSIGFLWNVWTDEGLRDPAFFDINDHFTFDEAGSPNKDNYRYPVKDVALVDSTCRLWYGFIPNGTEPGLCFTEENAVKRPGYGWCVANATDMGCSIPACHGKCPKNKFCVPCNLP